MNATSRDDGLVRKVGPWGLAASVVGIVVGAGIFAVPGALAAAVGPYAPFAFLVCGLAIGAVAICFAEGGSRMPTSGGVYGYIEAAFGPLTGYVAGMLLLVGDVLACGGVAAALADVAASVASKSLVPTVHAAVIVGVIGSVALINIAGVARAARFVSVATALKLIPLFIFIIVGCTRIDSANFVQAVQPDTEGLGRAAILALFSFIGMEAPLAASGEVAQPSRTIPRALAIAMVSVALIYVAIQIVAQGVLGASLAHSRAPLADAMGHISPLLRALMLAGAVVSMFGWISSDLLGSPRILFAFARDGLLPPGAGSGPSAYPGSLCCDTGLRGARCRVGAHREFRRVGCIGRSYDCRVVCRGMCGRVVAGSSRCSDCGYAIEFPLAGGGDSRRRHQHAGAHCTGHMDRGRWSCDADRPQRPDLPRRATREPLSLVAHHLRDCSANPTPNATNMPPVKRSHVCTTDGLPSTRASGRVAMIKHENQIRPSTA